ncbi:MAG: 2,3-bisphosphoglycerate-independent phosphoglycerate mutase [Candidatus Magasanikbacteria bacterium]|nr:2,3-bisphosphoglycerate-independent phosphoglycerate mutase [Candidatus Magasanikbacteria bacterium]
MKKTSPTLLVILDGWGYADPKIPGNAITPKTAPHYFSWFKKFPHTLLAASGEAVGLFPGQDGNSEAGHLNLGAGRVVKQDARYISDAIADGTFFKNQAFQQAIFHVRKYQTAAHVLGLLSNHNSAHSCPEHLLALLELFRREQVARVYLHLFTDGRDSGPHDAAVHLQKLTSKFRGAERIATVMGRFYAMDRNKNWDRIRLAYEAMVLGRGRQAPGAEAAVAEAYNCGESDEFISPTVIRVGNNPVATIRDNDAIFFFNLRSDRARELTKVFVQPDFEAITPGGFRREQFPRHTRFVAMTDFGPDLPGVFTAFPSRDIAHGLVAALATRPQLYVAESEKFAHITYFFNGGYARHLGGEQWMKIASDGTKHWQTAPAMKAHPVAEAVLKAIREGKTDFIAVNFANADMLGHTGNLAAARQAISILDRELNRLVKAVLKVDGRAMITADHGNAEELINGETKEVDTEHSANPVPCLLVASAARLRRWQLKGGQKLRPGKLADVAPTILKMMSVPRPRAMAGRPLF